MASRPPAPTGARWNPPPSTPWSAPASPRARIAPDVVLTQDLCAVCALPADAAREACELVGNPAQLVTLDPHTLAEVLAGATTIAAACRVPERGERLRRQLQQRLDAVAAG